MARYKTLKGVAHNLGHSFVGDMNWSSGDFAMGHSLRRARQTDCGELEIDLLSGSFGPSAMRSPEVAAVVQQYISRFPQIVVSQRSAMSLIESATMRVRFDHSRAKPNPQDPRLLETPYVCRVEIKDDRGKTWACDQTGWWTPESQRRDLLKRMLGRIFSWIP